MNTTNTVNTRERYRYSLDKSSKKFPCPSCGQKRFVKYIDSSTGEYMPDVYGRCDREEHCCYHNIPKSGKSIEVMNVDSNVKTEIDFLPDDSIERSVLQYKRCDLYPFLVKLFKEDIVEHLCLNYFVGSNKHGFTAFWQVDVLGNVRQCKIIPYQQDGHRDKEKVIKDYRDKEGELKQIKGGYFAGKEILKNKYANLQQCFFGEGLLSFPENKHKPVAIVESEKTALIASIYFPDFVWIATGGKHGAKWTERNVCKVLQGRKVILFPDVGAYDSWKAKGLLIAATAMCKAIVSDLLEKNATGEEREQGYDIADYLLRDGDSTGLALIDSYPVMVDYCYNNGE